MAQVGCLTLVSHALRTGQVASLCAALGPPGQGQGVNRAIIEGRWFMEI